MIRVATRGSMLAVVKARTVADGLAASGARVDVVPMRTEGAPHDTIRQREQNGCHARSAAVGRTRWRNLVDERAHDSLVGAQRVAIELSLPRGERDACDRPVATALQ